MANNEHDEKVIDKNNGSNKATNNKHEGKYKLITTWIICFCSFVYGLTSYIIGPALNDMKIKLNASTDSITIVFGCMLIGYTLGAVINGIIFNYINRQLVLTFLLFMMSVSIALAPFSPNLGLLFADAGLCGFGGGGIDTAQVVWIIEMWADKSSSYLAGYQFFFALGTFISPLIVRPFLAEERKSNYQNNSLSANETSTNNLYLTESVITYTESHIEIPFGIVSALLFISGLILLILHFHHRYEPPVEQNQQFVCKRPTKRKLIYIVLGLFTLAPYVGIEITNFQLIDTFAKYSHLQLSGPDSALVHSLLAGAFALCRGVIFAITFFYWSEKSIYLNLITIFIGNSILLFYQMDGHSLGYLWAGTIICGSGFSSMFPSIYAFLENQFTISNTIGGLFVCISGLVGAVLPTLCGQFIEGEPLTLVYVNYICATIISISFILFNIIIYGKSRSTEITKCVPQNIDSQLTF